MGKRRMLAPISSIKHYVARTNATVASGNVLIAGSANAVAKGNARSSTDVVEEGCVIKAVHLEYWLNGRGASNTTQFTFIVYKLPSEGAVPTASDMANLQAWTNKKNILFSSQGVLGQSGSQSIPVIRDWIMIPKGKQRFGLGDKFQSCLFASGESIQLCGMATYKEYE